MPIRSRATTRHDSQRPPARCVPAHTLRETEPGSAIRTAALWLTKQLQAQHCKRARPTRPPLRSYSSSHLANIDEPPERPCTSPIRAKNHGDAEHGGGSPRHRKLCMNMAALEKTVIKF